MNELFVNILLFLGGFALLAGGAEFLVRGASRLAVRLKVPLVVIGLTIVAFGTSLPELLVSMLANMQGGSASELAIGNVVGSNIANLALILGLVAVLRPVSVERELLFREYPLMLLVSVIFIGMCWNGQVGRVEGLILVAGLAAFTAYSYIFSRDLPELEQSEAQEYVEDVLDGDDDGTARNLIRDLLFIAVGVSILVLGANWLVNASQFIARYLGISELIIGLSLVALGTSLPELATSVVAIGRSEGDIALGNLVGSNLFNVLAIIGLASLVKPLPAPLHMRSIDFPVMMVVAILPMVLVSNRPHVMNRWNGAVMLAVYLAYNVWLFTSGNAPVV